MAKDSFVLYTDYLDHISTLPDDEAAKLFRGIFLYVGHDVPAEELGLGPAAAMAFSFIRQRLDKDIAKYEERCRTNSDNASKGGKAKAENARKRKQSLANASERQGTVANGSDGFQSLHDSESDGEYDCENDYENDCENECEGVIDTLARELSLSPSFLPKVHEWFRHKEQKHGKQTESSITSLMKLLKKHINKYGEDAVGKVIDYSINGGFGSLYFDRLEERSEENGQVGLESAGGHYEKERYGTHL